MDIPQPRLLEISFFALSIMIAPLLVLTGSELILGFWGDTGLTSGATLAFSANAELVARYHALAAFVFFASIAVSVTGIFVCDVVQRFGAWSRVKIVLALILVILVTMIFSVLEPEEMNSFETYQLLGEDLFRQALGAGKTGACLPDRASCATGNAFDTLVKLVDLSNHFVSLAGAAVLTGMILSLGRTGPEADVEQLREARRCAKRYLYCAGLLLTAGMIWVQAWMSWPAALIAEGAERDSFMALVNAFALFRGTTFSLLILSVYLPVYLVLSCRVDAVRRSTPDHIDMSKDAAFEQISYTEALKTITAIVAPILMGVVGSSWNVALGF